MDQCPYCRQNEIAMTLCTPEGNYSVCRPCAVQWGIKAQTSEVGLEVVALEKMWALPSAEVAR